MIWIHEHPGRAFRWRCHPGGMAGLSTGPLGLCGVCAAQLAAGPVGQSDSCVGRSAGNAGEPMGRCWPDPRLLDRPGGDRTSL